MRPTPFHTLLLHMLWCLHAGLLHFRWPWGCTPLLFSGLNFLVLTFIRWSVGTVPPNNDCCTLAVAAPCLISSSCNSFLILFISNSAISSFLLLSGGGLGGERLFGGTVPQDKFLNSTKAEHSSNNIIQNASCHLIFLSLALFSLASHIRGALAIVSS